MDKDALEGLISMLDNWAVVFTLLVVIGVGGELVIHVMQSRANRKLIALQKSEALAQEAEIAKANERTAKAELELARIKSPRSLTQIPELIRALEQFKGTEYVFVSVFGDEESISLLKEINEVLQRAGWKRSKSMGGFPAINVYGKGVPDFFVPQGLDTGVRVSTDSPRPITFDKVKIADLPAYIQAAGALNVGLSKCIFPQQENSVGKLANVETGSSRIVRIAVGKKP